MSGIALSPRAEGRILPAAVGAGVLATAAACWFVLAGRMSGMDAGPGGDPGSVGWFAATWALMTAAMMLPVAARPAVRLSRGGPAGASSAAVLFLAGYLAVWMAAGYAGYAAVAGFRALHASALAWGSGGRYIAGASVAAAGLYQLTAVKRRWLVRCTRPAGTSARPDLGRSLIAGSEHGMCCVACCSTLMVALYALGMMSLTWMAVVTIMIAGERLLPVSWRAREAVAVALVVLGLAVAAAPSAVPALTIPSHAGQAMMMGGG